MSVSTAPDISAFELAVLSKLKLRQSTPATTIRARLCEFVCWKELSNQTFSNRMSKMVKNGWLTVESGKQRNFYSLTKAGKDARIKGQLLFRAILA